MAGKFLNVEHKENIDTLVENAKSLLKNPYYIHSDRTGTAVTYFNQNKEKTTLDTSTKLYYQDVGVASPIHYNMIRDFMIYGIEQIAIQMVNDDFGPQADSIEGEAVILPNTIIPYVGDYFNIQYTDEDILFRVIDVTPDTLEDGSNIYKIQYKMESTSLEKILEEANISDHYQMIIGNVGTGLSSVIREESFNLVQSLENTLYSLRTYYKSIFFNQGVQTFTFVYNGLRYYDPYLIEFLKDTEVLSGPSEDYIYIDHVLNLSNLFPIKYRKTFFAALQNKDLCGIRSYEHRGLAKYITQAFSIFATRKEDYCEVYHDNIQSFDLHNILPCFKDELITAIESDTILGGENSMYNIIIKYFNNGEIKQDDINALDMIDFSDSIYLYYAIPCILYCIERFIVSLMEDKV